MQIDDLGLLEALSPDQSCGEDLEDTQLLASFDAYRLFGQTTPLPADTDWREIRDRSCEALGKSKDFRLLTHLAAAVVRTDGIDPFVRLLDVAAKWLETWWAEVYPRVDEDAILRRNALNGFGDRMAVIDGLRRVPLLVHPQLGSFSIRDIEIATGQQPPSEEDTEPPDSAQLFAILAATPVENLRALADQLEGALRSLSSIDETMRTQADSQSAPELDPLKGLVARTARLLSEHLSTRAPESIDEAPAEGGGDGGAVAPVQGAPITAGSIRSRDDALRALDAVATYFRNNEPSSPIPLFVERAKRLVSKDFLAVLEDIAPEAVEQAKAAGGIRDEVTE